MASDTRNVKLGVCRVYFDGADLGFTQGGVEVSVATETHPVMIDQFGKTNINDYVMGRNVKAKVPLAETTLANLVALFPGATLSTVSSRSKVDVSHGIGNDLLSLAKMLSFHPIKSTDPSDIDYTDDFTIPLANTPGALTYAYKLDAERIFNVEFNGYPNVTSGKLFIAGDPFTNLKTATFAVSTVMTTSGLVVGDTGRPIMVACLASSSDVLAAPLVARKTYYLKYISATTASLHLTAAAAVAGTGAISFTTTGTGVQSINFID